MHQQRFPYQLCFGTILPTSIQIFLSYFFKIFDGIHRSMHCLLLHTGMTLLVKGRRMVRCSRTHTKQQKMADDNSINQILWQKLRKWTIINVSMHRKDISGISNWKKFRFNDIPYSSDFSKVYLKSCTFLSWKVATKNYGQALFANRPKCCKLSRKFNYLKPQSLISWDLMHTRHKTVNWALFSTRSSYW